MANAGAPTIPASTDAEINGGHNILTIPPEVFELIATNAARADLLPLRLVSRETSQRVFRTYLKAHFTERAFLLSSEESLRTLLAISQNEVLARSLTRIDLSIEEVPGRDHECVQDGEPLPPITKYQTHEHALRTKHATERNMVVEQ